MSSLRLIPVALLLSVIVGCNDAPTPSGDLHSPPLDRFEPVVREQFESALAGTESGSAEDLAHFGMLCHAYDFPEHAESWLRQALALSPSDSRYSHALGLVLSDLGRPEEAAAAFETVLHAQPDNAPARLRLAEVELELGRLPQALELFESVVSHGGTNEAHARAGAGRALLRLGQPDRGRAQLEAALLLSPGHAPARYALATFLRDEGRLEESESHFRRARSDRDYVPPIDDPVARSIDDLAGGARTTLQRGMELRRKTGDHEASARLFEEAVQLDPGLAAAHAELGAVRLALGDLVGAEASLREALRLDPESANALYNLAWIAQRADRTEEALIGFRAAAELRPDDFDVLLGLGLCALRNGATDEGLSAMQRAIASRPMDPRPYRHLDTHYAGTGREALSIAVLRRGLRAIPNDASLMIRLAWHLATAPDAAQREPERALELARAVTATTDHPRALDALAAALAANGLFQDAVVAARRGAAAAEAAGNAEMARTIRSRLALYESDRAYEY